MSRSGTSELTRDEPLLRLEALAEEQAALRRVATLAAGDVDARQLFDCVCEELGRVLGVESTDILRFEGDGIATVVGGWFAPGGPSFPVGMTIPVEGQTVTAKLYRTGRPQRVDDYSEIGGELAARVRSFGIVSAAGAPIMVAGRLWGGTMASSTRPHAFPEGTEQRIADFAELVTAALANADARDQLAASRARIVEAGYAERSPARPRPARWRPAGARGRRDEPEARPEEAVRGRRRARGRRARAGAGRTSRPARPRRRDP